MSLLLSPLFQSHVRCSGTVVQDQEARSSMMQRSCIGVGEFDNNLCCGLRNKDAGKDPRKQQKLTPMRCTVMSGIRSSIMNSMLSNLLSTVANPVRESHDRSTLGSDCSVCSQYDD